jgi:hypothetical protein
VNGKGGTPAKKAFEGNQAIPYLLFGPSGISRTLDALKEMNLVTLETFCLFAYLLSFGFKPLNLMPEFLHPAVAGFERWTMPLWRRMAALRVFLALEKTSDVRRLAGSPVTSR